MKRQVNAFSTRITSKSTFGRKVAVSKPTFCSTPNQNCTTLHQKKTICQRVFDPSLENGVRWVLGGVMVGSSAMMYYSLPNYDRISYETKVHRSDKSTESVKSSEYYEIITTKTYKPKKEIVPSSVLIGKLVRKANRTYSEKGKIAKQCLTTHRAKILHYIITNKLWAESSNMLYYVRTFMKNYLTDEEFRQIDGGQYDESVKLELIEKGLVCLKNITLKESMIPKLFNKQTFDELGIDDRRELLKFYFNKELWKNSTVQININSYFADNYYFRYSFCSVFKEELFKHFGLVFSLNENSLKTYIDYLNYSEEVSFREKLYEYIDGHSDELPILSEALCKQYRKILDYKFKSRKESDTYVASLISKHGNLSLIRLIDNSNIQDILDSLDIGNFSKEKKERLLSHLVGKEISGNAFNKLTNNSNETVSDQYFIVTVVIDGEEIYLHGAERFKISTGHLKSNGVKFTLKSIADPNNFFSPFDENDCDKHQCFARKAHPRGNTVSINDPIWRSQNINIRADELDVGSRIVLSQNKKESYEVAKRVLASRLQQSN